MAQRKRFFYNMNTCIGCGSCQVACKDHHGLLPGEFFRRAGMQDANIDGKTRPIPFSISCNHCDHPACTAVCPTGAMHQQEDGLVLHDDAPCIGCGRCYWACPYGEVSFSLSRGVTQKCDACSDLRSQGFSPACVAACPTASLRFGELPDDVGELPDLSFLPDPALTGPSLRIKKTAAVKEAESHD